MVLRVPRIGLGPTGSTPTALILISARQYGGTQMPSQSTPGGTRVGVCSPGGRIIHCWPEAVFISPLPSPPQMRSGSGQRSTSSLTAQFRMATTLYPDIFMILELNGGGQSPAAAGDAATVAPITAPREIVTATAMDLANRRRR